ncbi:MAG TPA: hypothetical protein ACFYED_00015 [Candidatus Tripitaka californicus]|uniref:hypothetical protein n=1 Tax=Candidatus Tripitaka californicus TaxID=3367616 RepID=UPI00402611A5
MKRWNGLTPQYDEPALIDDIVDRNRYRREGFVDAMNSPVVRNGFAALSAAIYVDRTGRIGMNETEFRETVLLPVLALYTKDWEEVPDA